MLFLDKEVTLRDVIAIIRMAARSVGSIGGDVSPEDTAKDAYAAADEMLKHKPNYR